LPLPLTACSTASTLAVGVAPGNNQASANARSAARAARDKVPSRSLRGRTGRRANPFFERHDPVAPMFLERCATHVALQCGDLYSLALRSRYTGDTGEAHIGSARR
jgi:hypothetical protein